MASDSQEALVTVAVTTLRADSTLQTLTGASPARVWNYVPQTEWEKPNAAGLFLPYVVVRTGTGTHFDTKTSDGMDQKLDVTSWSRGRGELEVIRMTSAVIDALDQQALSLTGHDLVELVFDQKIPMAEDDGLTFGMLARFNVLTSEQ